MIHTVEQGECLSSIADRYGFVSWRAIYDDAANSDFRARRPNPNLIYPGDVIVIPDRADVRSEDAPTGARSRYRRARARTRLTLKVSEHVGPVLSGCRFKLSWRDHVVTGVVPGDGVIDEEVPAGQREAALDVYVDGEGGVESCYQWKLLIGHLDPLETVSGIQARLNNLWFYAGPVDGDQGPMTTAAIRAFQRAHALEEDGIAGPITRGKLQEVYGA